MKENNKLQEAEYFHEKMTESIDFPIVFEYNLSAFLCASRSVLQYLLKNVKNQTEGQSWYDNLIKNSKYAKYFKNKRDINIHQDIIQTKKGIDIKNREAKIIYYFDNCDGDEDVIQLCKNYLDELNLFLQEGIKKRFLNYF